jgi:hypothetical protein
MAVYFLNKDWKKIEENILEIYVEESRDEILVSDIREKLRWTYGWRGLTSRDIKFAPVDAKFKSELVYVGSFEDVMVHFGYKVRNEVHGAGSKALARI